MPEKALKALLGISRIALKKPLNPILGEILTTVCQEIGGHSGSLMLVNGETGELDMVATFGLPDDCIDRVYARGYPITCSPSGEVLRTGEFYVVPNIFEELRDKLWADLGRELGFSAQLFMPMKHNGEIIGLLNIHMAEPHKYTQNEIAFVSIAASQAAAVIENARLYAKINKEKAELESEITEHKRVEELLWESKEILNEILSASPIGIGIVKDRKLSWTNERMLEMMGFKPDDDPHDYVGQSAEVIYASKEEYERVGQIFYNELRRANLVEVDAKLKRIDGSLFDGHIKMCFLDPSNPVKGAIATVSDISWRKHAEEALQRSETKYRHLFENLSDAAFLADVETGRIIEVNKQAELVLGRTHYEIIGMHQSELHPPGKAQEYRNRFALHVEEGHTEDYDGEIIRKDGTVVPVNIRAAPLNISERPLILEIFRDITERKEVEEALQESEERFRSLFDNLSIGMAMIDREGRVLAANKTVCHFLDYSQEELIGRPLTELIYPEDLNTDRDLFDSIIKGENDHCLLDKRCVRKDSEIVWGRLHVSGIKDEEGYVKYMSVICDDITACKLVEKALVSKSAEMAGVVAKCKHMKEALKRSEQKYKEIADFLPDLIYKSIMLDA